MPRPEIVSAFADLQEGDGVMLKLLGGGEVVGLFRRHDGRIAYVDPDPEFGDPGGSARLDEVADVLIALEPDAGPE